MSFRRLAHCLLLGKPYFGRALYARQGVVDRHRYFVPAIRVARGERRGPLRILEVGSWAGASAVSWAKGLEAVGGDGKVLCVDSWTPYFDTSRDSKEIYAAMNEAAESGDIFRLFKHNVATSGVGSRIEYRCGESRQVLPALPSGSFDLIYLDGSHQYEQASFDVQESARLIADGGIICGDDLELQRDQLVGEEHAGAVASSRDYVRSESTKCWYHPGVTEAVAEFFGPVAAWNGFWAVRRNGGAWVAAELSLEGSEIPRHLTQDPEIDDQIVELVRQTGHYNIVQAGGRFLAVAKSLGPVNLFDERLGERELGGLLLIGSSLEEVHARAEEAERADSVPIVTLVAETNEYNIVQAGGQFLAVAKSLGPVDLFNEPLGERDLGHLLFVGSSLAEIRARAEQAERAADT